MRCLIVNLALIFAISSVGAAVLGNVGQKESPEHGGKSPHEKFREEHYAGGDHHVEKDHEAILGYLFQL